MSDVQITCPNCGHRFPVSDALSAQIRDTMEANLRADFDKRLKREVALAEKHAHEQMAPELKLLTEQLAEARGKAAAAQQAELALRKKAEAVEARGRELDLEVARRLDAEKQRLEESLRRAAGEEQALKLREKDKQIDDLKALVEEMKRKSEQGSQERQGEVLELDIEERLGALFPHDQIRPVPKGMRGADLVQEVCGSGGQACGTIVWETKNTRNWSPAWIDKLKEDQRAVGASLAVLVSVALPGEIREFGRVNGVWVASLNAWPALALALREQLVAVAFARATSEGRQEKMALLYDYLSGEAFHRRVEAIVEAFTAMQTQLNGERRAMERLWREREKQIERVITHTAGMYGEVRGLVGASLPEIPALTLEGVAGLLEGDTP